MSKESDFVGKRTVVSCHAPPIFGQIEAKETCFPHEHVSSVCLSTSEWTKAGNKAREGKGCLTYKNEIVEKEEELERGKGTIKRSRKVEPSRGGDAELV